MGHRPLEKYEVIKHIAAIHINNRLSLVEQKVSNVLLWNAWEHLVDTNTHTIRISDLAEAVGFDSKDLTPIKEALRALRNTEIQWNILGKDKKNVWGVSGILAEAFIFDETGLCEYSFPEKVRAFLRNPNIYARVNMLIQQQFDSRYTNALWEYAAGEVATSEEMTDIIETPWLELDRLHTLIGSIHKTYQDFRIFNRDILKPSIAEINRLSNIEITNVEFRREMRRITAVRFVIHQKRTYQLPLGFKLPRLFLDDIPIKAELVAQKQKEQKDHSELIARLIDNGIDEKVARGLVRGYGKDRITENLAWAVRQIQSGRQIERPGGFITSAIRRDFVAPERVKKRKAEAREERERSRQETEAFVEKIQGDFWLYKVDLVNARIANMSAEERAQFERTMEEANVFRTTARWEEYRREGIADKREHTALRGIFFGFAIRHLLTADEQDIVAFARSKSATDAIILELQKKK